MRKQAKKIILLVGCIILLLSYSVMGLNVKLTWQPNSEPDMSHYIVYYGTESRNYTSNSGNIGLVTEYSIDLPDNGKVYYFAVTAIDTSALESDFSNEVNTFEFISGDDSCDDILNMILKGLQMEAL